MTRPGRVFQQNLASSKGGDGFPALFVFEMSGGRRHLKRQLSTARRPNTERRSAGVPRSIQRLRDWRRGVLRRHATIL